MVGAAASVQPLLAVAALIALPCVALLFVRPDWLPVALVMTVFLEGIALGGVQLSRVIAPLAALIVVLYLVSNRGLVWFPLKAVLIAVGGYATWAFASSLWSAELGSFSESFSGTLFELASLALSLVFMVTCAVLIDSLKVVRRVIAAIWAMAVIVGIVAIFEYLAGSARSVGYTGDANFFAATQVVALPITIAFATTTQSGAKRTAAFLGTAVVAGSVLTSLSRGGILALLGILFLLAIQPARIFFDSPARKRMAILAALVGASVMLALSYSDLKERTSSVFNLREGTSGRTFLWESAYLGWKQHPALGLGYGAFPPESNQLLLENPGTDLSVYALRPTGQVVHNTYLGSLAELGPVGLLLFVSVLGSAISTLRKVARQADREGNDYLSTLARALVVAVCGYALTSIFLSTETDRALWILLGLTLALPRFLDWAPARELRRS
jgi:O-antigen ligase